ncbi:MAG: hypothetical protein ACE5OP_11120 [Candidatus Glassbacteria bacterium]
MNIPISLSLFMIYVFNLAWSAQDAFPAGEETLGEFYARYEVDNWPGKNGYVVPGIKLDALFTNDNQLVVDHETWIDMGGERVVMRQLTTGDNHLIVNIAVARTCETAHQILFSHLVRPKSMQPFEPPALPYGEVRITDIGDVCFGLPQQEKETFHSIEFVRNNIVILLRTKLDTTMDARSIAKAIDEVILEQPVYPNWRSSGLWISIDRFEITNVNVKSGSTIPIILSVTDPMNESFIKAWELSAGGILEEDGKISYYAEGSGRQTITLLVANQSGLAASAQIELVVMK